MADARNPSVSLDGRFVLGYHSALDLMNAIVASLTGSHARSRWTHAARIEACGAGLPEHADLFRRIDLVRQARNLVIYSGRGTEQGVLEQLLFDLDELRQVTHQVIGTQ